MFSHTFVLFRKQPMLFSNADILLMNGAYFILGTTVQAALYGYLLYTSSVRDLYTFSFETRIGAGITSPRCCTHRS